MHETSLRVRWSELDPYNHVNHAVYLSYFEAARIEALTSIGWGMDVLERAGMLILVADLTVRFRRPARAGDEVTIQTEVKEVRGASTRWVQRLIRDGELLVEAEVVGAITDLDGRPRRLSPELRDALSALVEVP